jgi:hypothetical protein
MGGIVLVGHFALWRLLVDEVIEVVLSPRNRPGD